MLIFSLSIKMEGKPLNFPKADFTNNCAKELQSLVFQCYPGWIFPLKMT